MFRERTESNTRQLTEESNTLPPCHKVLLILYVFNTKFQCNTKFLIYTLPTLMSRKFPTHRSKGPKDMGCFFNMDVQD